MADSTNAPSTTSTDCLTENEVIRTYEALYKKAEFYSLWLSFELLLEEENRKLLRIQRHLQDPKTREQMLAATAKEMEQLKLDEARLTNEQGKKQVQRDWKILERRKQFDEDIAKQPLQEFSVYPKLARQSKDATKEAIDFFEAHWRILTMKKYVKPKEASQDRVEEKMTGKELQEVVRLLRGQHETMLSKLH